MDRAARLTIFVLTATLMLMPSAAMFAVEQSVSLSSLELAKVQQGWGTAQVGKSVKGLPMVMAGKLYTDGVGTHSPSIAVVCLDGKADRFRATVGVNDIGRTEPGSVEFLVFGDEKLLFKSGILRGGDRPQVIDVPLTGLRSLKLQVTDGGDNNNSDHANWADAVIRYSGKRPELVDPSAAFAPVNLYPPADKLIASPGNTTYYVDPDKGNDANAGITADTPWASLAKVNALALAPGDKVVIAAGIHDLTLKPSAAGTKEKPVTIQFLPGRHEFRGANAIKLCYFVSNSADAPLKPRPIGILVKNARHLSIVGGKDCEICYGDRMTELINDQSEDITYSGLNFDFVRPTVSEFRVLESGANSVLMQVAEGSTYAIENGRFQWTGNLGAGGTMVQQADPVLKTCWRLGRWNPFGTASAEDLGGGKIRLTYKNGNYGMIKGRQFQFRNVERDTTSAVNTRSKDIAFRDCNFYSLPGMGIVSQFTENVTFERVNVAPRPGTFRTCAAWADCFHFSGCRGDILVDSCRFSGTQDDPINVHGTHLRIIEKTGPKHVLVRFMQPQTYGIAAFQPGDRVEFVNHQSLRAYAANEVSGLHRKTDKDWLLTFERPVAEYGNGDVVDNISWYPNVTIRNCTVDTDSCRGFLITTRGKALIEDCTFIRTRMSAILVEDDAEGWFESGPIRELTIRNNRFIQCGQDGSPAAWINPQNGNNDPALPVHENIRIENNYFNGSGISAKSVKGLTISGNRFSAEALPLQLGACTQVTVDKNEVGVQTKP